MVQRELGRDKRFKRQVAHIAVCHVILNSRGEEQFTLSEQTQVSTGGKFLCLTCDVCTVNWFVWPTNRREEGSRNAELRFATEILARVIFLPTKILRFKKKANVNSDFSYKAL
jgi:hypothetical protein